MTIKELQALSTVADMLIELAQTTKIPFDETEQKLSYLEREDYRPPCGFCEQMKSVEYINGRGLDGNKVFCPVIYCPACGRVLRAKEAEECEL